MTSRARRLAALLVLAVVATGVWSCAAHLATCDGGVARLYTGRFRSGRGADRQRRPELSPLRGSTAIASAWASVAVVIVPVLRSPWDEEPISVRRGIAELMCSVAGIAPCDTFEAVIKEPISLNLAFDAAATLEARGARSVLLVTPGFRSQRSLEVYGAVLGPRGIAVQLPTGLRGTGPIELVRLRPRRAGRRAPVPQALVLPHPRAALTVCPGMRPRDAGSPLARGTTTGAGMPIFPSTHQLASRARSASTSNTMVASISRTWSA